MEEMLPVMTRATEKTVDLVRGIREEQFGGPTPCSEYTVKELIGHLEWVSEAFESMAKGGSMVPQGEYAGDFPERARRTLAAWSRPEAWEGTSPGLGLPMSTLAQMFLVDMVAHGWDLARATGQPYEPDPEAVSRAWQFAGQMAEMGRQQGAFGPAVEVPEDAPVFDRLLGTIGRDPSWRP
ncbi:TIGR03086 family metal-binding protein [Nonomuraea sp. NPDC050310]|uniref:TIGR03086 family metal-binding protein n=1 Tax=Nonomuraea sp. NPDC050310 TaxID=3154935 RepID=UPI0033F95A57